MITLLRTLSLSFALTAAALAGCSKAGPDTPAPATRDEAAPVDRSTPVSTRAETGDTELSDTFRLVMLGDSITAGFGLDNPRLLTDRLNAYFAAQDADVLVINAGVSGDRMQDGAARFDWSVGPEADGVLIALGGNDLLRGAEPATTRASLAAMLEKARERELFVAIAGLRAPGNATPAFANEYNSLFDELSAEYCAPLYENFLAGVIGDASLNQEDGIHPTADGVAILVDNFAPWLAAALNGAHDPC